MMGRPILKSQIDRWRKRQSVTQRHVHIRDRHDIRWSSTRSAGENNSWRQQRQERVRERKEKS